MKKKFLALMMFVVCFAGVTNGQNTNAAQSSEKQEIPYVDGEYWWGGVVAFGGRMPYAGNVRLYDLSVQHNNNAVTPLFVSSKGRYVWSDDPFKFEVKDNMLVLYSDSGKLEVVEAGKTLRDAYLTASRKHFPPTGTIPDELFFQFPSITLG